MSNETQNYWINQKTGKTEFRNAPTTDAEAMQYISQAMPAQGMYVCYRNLGLSIHEAMINVLSACVGEPAPFKTKS